MLKLSGSARYYRLSQPCPGHKRKDGFLNFPPEFQEFWTAHLRDRAFGSRSMQLFLFIGFSICHLAYDDKHMLWVVQHLLE
jgi:hypothetical protein